MPKRFTPSHPFFHTLTTSRPRRLLTSRVLCAMSVPAPSAEVLERVRLFARSYQAAL